MFFYLERLCREIGDEKSIIIYGTGFIAMEIYDKFQLIGWSKRIACFTVSSVKAQPEYIDTIPVIKFEEELLENGDICLLVAVGDTYLKEIREILGGIFPKKVLYLWEYRVSEVEKREILLNASFDKLCRYALDEYIWNKPDYLNDKETLLENLKRIIYERTKEQKAEKNIVYILEEETARDVKIIKALLEKEYSITVLQWSKKEQYAAEKELRSLGIMIERFTMLWDFITISLKYKPMLYLFDTETTFEYALVSIRHRDKWDKVVIAPYETFMGSFTDLNPQIIEFEKFCLENADAVVWRYFSKDYLQNEMGYQYKGESIQLLDNCGGYKITSQMKESRNDKLRLCCVVSQIESFLQQDTEAYTQLARFSDLLERLDESCVLHVFVWTASVDAERELKNLEEKYANFKYFLKTEHNRLINRLCTYDYGLCVYTDERIPTYPAGAEMIHGVGFKCTEGTYRYSVANRYFDYIDAELSIVTTLPEKLCEYLQKFNVIVRMNINNFDYRYLKANKEYYKKQAKIAKGKLSMRRQIDSLTDMFDRICSE